MASQTSQEKNSRAADQCAMIFMSWDFRGNYGKLPAAMREYGRPRTREAESGGLAGWHV
tara:strand:+ start:245 stop:421 length:177 start_codon:yes stop_codon:yes gene_type:complete